MAKTTPAVHFNTLTYFKDEQPVEIAVESQDWYNWLESATSFAYGSSKGSFTARKEQAGHKRGGSYWRAYRKIGGKLYQSYLGRDEELTLVRLNEIATLLLERGQSLSSDANSISPGEEASSAPVATSSATPVLSPLLTTKLHTPVPRAKLVERARLLQRLEQVIQYKLTLISAPPGFGKTTLIASWLQRSGLAAAWFSLDAGDSDPGRFWSYLDQTLKTLPPECGYSESLPAGMDSQAEAPVEILLGKLLKLSQHIVIVLDDYHLIENETIQRDMAYLLERLPATVHLILTSRTDPPFPLARMRVRGELQEIRAFDLRFDSQEADTFLSRVMNLKLSEQELETLEGKTEGWVAGLQLAALGMQGSKNTSAFIEAFKGSHHFMLDYLTEEVLQRQPPEVQHFLLQTAILERLTASLVEELTGCADGQALLEKLEQSNLFVIALDDERNWYRYHHLFKEYLLRRLQQLQPEHIPLLHRLAARWYEAQGMITEAISHSLAAPDYPLAAALIQKVAQPTILRGEGATVSNWLKAFPENARREYPGLRLIEVWVLVVNGQTEEVESILEETLNEFEPAILATQDRQNEVGLIRSFIALQNLDLAKIQQIAGQPLTPSISPFIRSFILLFQAFTHDFKGETQKAAQMYEATIKLSRETNNLFIALVAYSQLGDTFLAKGRLHRAHDIYQQSLDLIQTTVAPQPEETPLLWECLSDMGLGQVYYQWNELELAQYYYEKAIMLSESYHNITILKICCLMLAQVKQAQGDKNGALACIRKAGEAGNDSSGDFLSLYIESFLARLALAEGNLEVASSWAEQYWQTITGDKESVHHNLQLREVEGAIYARVLLAEGRLAEAIEFLSSLFNENITSERLSINLQIRVLLAQAYRIQGDTTRALASLKKALEIAEPEGYIRVFADEGLSLVGLLARLGRTYPDTVSPKYLKKVLEACGGTEAAAEEGVSEQVSDLAESLSKRELEILRLLDQGLASQEIARELVLSTGTVNWHIKNLYGKLGIHNRTQALARARQLSLL
ncbi:MAG TPA: LuxR C-terminal-related transcriptional regulator [Chloroflexia bacterium]|nr:LuxR C-terminal-related transcriptional regulator [Chloroflexia bacterium]